ncbi:MAG TPA: chloride channel protein, partial [Candidatus Methylomirabilis sp.]|nr:chloride channel protein [Candidatus Methylomirabilis sp.]
ALLVVAKLLVTCLTLGSGASGGVFSPSLFLGAAGGAALAGIANALLPGIDLAPAHFAVATMAGMIAGTTGAVMTAVVMLFEMTWDYGLILPTILAAAVAYATRQGLSPSSIYTLKLLRRGDVVPQGLQAWIAGTRRARDVMSTAFVLSEADPFPVQTPPADRAVILVRGGEIAGVAAGGEPGSVAVVTVAAEDGLGVVLRAMEIAGAKVALVTRDRTSASALDLVGVITDRELAVVVRSTAHLTE